MASANKNPRRIGSRSKGSKGAEMSSIEAIVQSPEVSSIDGSHPATVGDVLEYLLGVQWNTADVSPLMWPPDMFVIAAWLLKESGAYLCVSESRDWPPGNRSRSDWAKYAGRVGEQWREWCVANKLALKMPRSTRAIRDVARCWSIVGKSHKLELTAIRSDKSLWSALVMLIAFTDEACSGCGVPSMRVTTHDGFREKDHFEIYVQSMLYYQLRQAEADRSRNLTRITPATLCRIVNPSKASALPKLHTPLNGVTIRSMTHNLALVQGSAVDVHWVETVTDRSAGFEDSVGDAINLLVVPWPFTVGCSDFRRFARTKSEACRLAIAFLVLFLGRAVRILYGGSRRL